MIDVSQTKLTTLAGLIASREVTSKEITEAYLARIERYNPQLNAYLKVFGSEAVAQAEQLDRETALGEIRSPLHGVPIAIKDIIDIKGYVTTAGGVLLPDTPAAEDAEVIRRLREAGAVFLGKLNLHEYAWGGTTDNPHFGKCINPWKAGYSPGGSSGGSAAAVSAGLCAAALGTDTLGSVRIPSSYCGCTGIKTTYGLVSNRGVYPLSWSLDTVGPLASCAEDAAVMLSVMAGPDAEEPTSAQKEIGSVMPPRIPGIKGTKIGIIAGYSVPSETDPAKKVVSDAVGAAIEQLVRLGAIPVEFEIPEINALGLAAINIALVEAAAIHEEHMSSNPDKIGEDVRGRLQIGKTLSGTDLAKFQRSAAEIRVRFEKILREVDCILFPTTETTAHAFVPQYTNSTARYTAAANGLGFPAVSVPCGFSDEGLPIGLQILAGPFEESKALRIAAAYESATEWRKRKPRD